MWAGMGLALAALAVDIWALVEIGFRRGVARDNLFGAAA
jgi:hypothetical protein